jgi:hypothetical protein
MQKSLKISALGRELFASVISKFEKTKSNFKLLSCCTVY